MHLPRTFIQYDIEIVASGDTLADERHVHVRQWIKMTA
jgi:hypothetical protein